MNIQDWFTLGWTGWISLQSKGLSRVFSTTTVQKHQFFGAQLSSQSNSHIHPWLLEKTIALARWTFVGKVISLRFNMLSRLVITFLPRSKRLLISQLQSPSAVILELQKIVSHCFHCFPIYLPWSDGAGCMIFVFWMSSFKPTFSLSSFTEAQAGIKISGKNINNLRYADDTTLMGDREEELKSLLMKVKVSLGQNNSLRLKKSQA